ncbi:universal stress protein [Streptomyces sp. NPDC050504]|uniref:universal stress protein n=1 Tax=Streptomyces sp. NPDC050504 TaxID=3365618 RepID=UPI0037A468C2
MSDARIVVGVDGSEPSRRALRWAADQARLTGARLEAVIAWEDPRQWNMIGFPVLPDDYAPESVADQVLAEAIERTFDGPPPVEITRHVIPGHAADAIIGASDGASLVVVGARGRSGFSRALLGSVSNQVAQHAAGPVVIVRG